MLCTGIGCRVLLGSFTVLKCKLPYQDTDIRMNLNAK